MLAWHGDWDSCSRLKALGPNLACFWRGSPKLTLGWSERFAKIRAAYWRKRNVRVSEGELVASPTANLPLRVMGLSLVFEAFGLGNWVKTVG